MGNNIEKETSSPSSQNSSNKNVIKASYPNSKNGSSNKKLNSSSKNTKAANDIRKSNSGSNHGGNRQGEKKKKVIVSSKESNITKDLNNEYNVLEIIKKNNHDDTDHELIEKCLLNHFFMRSLEKQARNEIIKEMTLCKVKPKEYIFKQGSIGNFFYIIKEGDVDLLIDDKKIKVLKSGESFGELALLHGAPRSGTVISTNGSLLWCMERRNFRKIIDHINAINYNENIQFINGITLFTNLNKNLKTILARNLIKVYYDPKQIIVKEGDLASCLYIIKEGEVDCIRNGKFIRTLKSKDYFGEKSILLESKRTLDVIAKTKCVCYVISVDSLKNMVGDKYIDVLLFNFLEMAFQTSQCFNKVNPNFFENFFNIFTLRDFTKGEIVVPAGHHIGSTFFIIIEGSLTQKSSSSSMEYKRGQILFENELVSYDPKNPKKNKLGSDLLADPDCLVLTCDTSKLMKMLGSSFKEIFSQSSALSSLNSIPIFMNISQSKLSYLTKVVKVVAFANKTAIIKQGEAGDTFYIVKKGKVDIYKDQKFLRTINDNESFGFKALFNKEIRTASAIANGNVECYTLSSSDFKQILEEKLINYLKNKMMLEDDEVNLNDLVFIKDLGVGSFGTVSLVKSQKNKYLYAIKAMNRTQIDCEKLHKNIELERGILLRIDHPFITKLVKSLKNDKYIFFLMEFNKGKELWDVIRDIGLLNKYQTQFYIASTMLAIDYLHSRHFVHRDIKPENIMILDNGYLKLIDFGTCKEVVDKTSTIIGTPHYMAPEAILGEGYTCQVDYWSIGIMMYEFVCGGVPFGEGAEDPMEVYKIVIHGVLKFPSFVKDKEFIDIIKKMLVKSPMARLNNLTQIKAHPYFKGFSFEQLLNFGLEPPYKSKVAEIDTGGSKLYNEHIKTFKKYVSHKEKNIEPKLQKEYDKWFEKF